jgi:hypothetical protein
VGGKVCSRAAPEEAAAGKSEPRHHAPSMATGEGGAGTQDGGEGGEGGVVCNDGARKAGRLALTPRQRRRRAAASRPRRRGAAARPSGPGGLGRRATRAAAPRRAAEPLRGRRRRPAAARRRAAEAPNVQRPRPRAGALARRRPPRRPRRPAPAVRRPAPGVGEAPRPHRAARHPGPRRRARRIPSRQLPPCRPAGPSGRAGGRAGRSPSFTSIRLAGAQARLRGFPAPAPGSPLLPAPSVSRAATSVAQPRRPPPQTPTHLPHRGDALQPALAAADGVKEGAAGAPLHVPHGKEGRVARGGRGCAAGARGRPAGGGRRFGGAGLGGADPGQRGRRRRGGRARAVACKGGPPGGRAPLRTER